MCLNPWRVLKEAAGAQRTPQSRRGSLRTTLTAAQRSLRPPEAPGVCGLSKTGAFFLPFPWRDYQLHLSQKLRLNLLSRSRESRGFSARRVGLSTSTRRPSEFEIAKVRTEPQQIQGCRKASCSCGGCCIPQRRRVCLRKLHPCNPQNKINLKRTSLR